MALEAVNLILVLLVFGLIILFVVSFTLFIRRVLINSTIKNNEANEVEKKLDKIIEQNNKLIALLEKKD
ncbi:Na+-transporting NADH:ubiquinone oxidoreductase subunit NqrF [Lysinibacillus composti]|uniref:DUF4083 domain-containing protein n=1 Tax=Lysinibacillus composti TaxID=720633 RepID=A0A3N9UAQ3_9BACI|nr:DUF4083 family protein [Lysinibacillus composti]MBM7609811.1 Na+-transporting NADH:ubiquinone oxidoreductase subunit NqrF [Lysinibacillus composti]RQW73584.1 DUF4083 domain-containing protein [Lysinibacillus composti]